MAKQADKKMHMIYDILTVNVQENCKCGVQSVVTDLSRD